MLGPSVYLAYLARGRVIRMLGSIPECLVLQYKDLFQNWIGWRFIYKDFFRKYKACMTHMEFSLENTTRTTQISPEQGEVGPEFWKSKMLTNYSTGAPHMWKPFFCTCVQAVWFSECIRDRWYSQAHRSLTWCHNAVPSLSYGNWSISCSLVRWLIHEASKGHFFLFTCHAMPCKDARVLTNPVFNCM